MEQELLILSEHLCSSPFFVGIVLFMSSNYMSSVFLNLFCDVRYDFLVKMMFGLSLFPYTSTWSIFYLCLFTYNGVQRYFKIR